MASVVQKNTESLERMISRFRRIMLRSGKIKQTKGSRYFKKELSKELTKQKAQFREKRRAQALENKK